MILKWYDQIHGDGVKRAQKWVKNGSKMGQKWVILAHFGNMPKSSFWLILDFLVILGCFPEWAGKRMPKTRNLRSVLNRNLENGSK